jgi:hypothetical protein
MGRLLVIGLASLALLAEGCGGGGGGSKSNGEADKTAKEIVADAKAAAKKASSVHFHGSIVESGTPLKVDIRIDGAKGGTGSLTIQGAKVEIVRVGNEAYLKGSTAFYTQIAGAAAAQLLKGKWLKGSATSGDLAALAALTDINKLFEAALKPTGTITKGKEATVDGRNVIGVDSSDGGTLYVATTDEPYPIEITQASGNSTGTLHFDEWNKMVDVKAPTNAVDVSKLNG